jgi:hypothetical protein
VGEIQAGNILQCFDNHDENLAPVNGRLKAGSLPRTRDSTALSAPVQRGMTRR